MSQTSHTLIRQMLRAFEAKDPEGAAALFAPDAVFYDPHYPTPEMHGRPAIKAAFADVFTIIEEPSFSIRHFWSNGNSGAAEVDTHHHFADGSEARFPQAFVFEVRAGLLTRLQAYVPYPPPAGKEKEAS